MFRSSDDSAGGWFGASKVAEEQIHLDPTSKPGAHMARPDKRPGRGDQDAVPDLPTPSDRARTNISCAKPIVGWPGSTKEPPDLALGKWW